MSLRLGITTFGADGGRSGIGSYVIQLLRAIARQVDGASVEVLVHGNERSAFVPPDAGYAVLEVGRCAHGPLRGIAWHQAVLPFTCRRRGYDALFLPAGNRRLPLVLPCPSVGAVHDFASLHVPNKYDAARLFYIRHVLPLLVRRLTRVIVPSQQSRIDVVEHAGVPDERVTVIPNAVDHDVFRAIEPRVAASRIAERLHVSGPYLLYVARIEDPGKNHVRLIQAYSRLKSRVDVPHRLVLAGSDWSGAERVHAAAARSPHAKDIVFAGFVPAADLPDLYAAATALVFPSLYEGFGIPILEAMACGVPVACSNAGSIPEVAGDAALSFPPEDIAAMDDAMYALIADDSLRAELVRRGLARAGEFDWARTASATLDVLSRAASEGAA